MAENTTENRCEITDQNTKEELHKTILLDIKKDIFDEVIEIKNRQSILLDCINSEQYEKFIKDILTKAKYYNNNSDIKKTIECYIECYQLGSSSAANTLGILYKRQNELEKARISYKIAYLLGDTKYAPANLASFLLKENNYQLAEKYLLMSINSGSVSAAVSLAKIYNHLKNYTESIKFYTKAAELGDAESMVEVGKNFEKCEKYENALQYYKRAIDKKYVKAQKYYDDLINKTKRKIVKIHTLLEDNCIICSDPLKSISIIVTAVCGHTFHYKCLKQWSIQKNTCPICCYELNFED